MNDVWVLTAKTLLGGGEFLNDGWKTTCRVFENFDIAKKEMRLLIKKYATEENPMFDGNGRMIYFQDFVDNDDFYEHRFKDVQDFLQSFLINENFPESPDDILQISEDDEEYNDCFIFCKCDENELLIHEAEDAMIGELEPYIHTNALIMSDAKKDYFIYISDLFTEEQEGLPSRIYIDLKKVEVE